MKHHRPLSRRDAIEKQAQEAKRPRAKVKDLQRPVNAACICHFASLPGSQRIAVAAAELRAAYGEEFLPEVLQGVLRPKGMVDGRFVFPESKMAGVQDKAKAPYVQLMVGLVLRVRIGIVHRDHAGAVGADGGHAHAVMADEAG